MVGQRIRITTPEIGDARYLNRWQANTAYTANAIVVNASGQIVKAKANFTSGTTYDSNNWTIIAGGIAPVASVAGRTGDVTLTKTDVGLDQVTNTSDANKPISTAAQTALDAKADLVGGFIKTTQIPSLALNTVVTVASRSEMLALTSSQVQPGDVAVDTSTGSSRGTYMLINADPTVIGNWVLLTSPTDAVVSVNGLTGTVVIGKSDIGLANVDNTSDVNKPVSTAQGTALAGKEPVGLSSDTRKSLTPGRQGILSRSFVSLYEPGGTYTYPPRMRPAEQRTIVRVMNVGQATIQVGYGPSLVDNNANYSGSNWSVGILPGQEWVDTSGSPKAIVIRSNDTTSTPLYAMIYTEVVN